MVTLYDVAQRAGVSIATVSRVLHGQDTVRESTRDRVRAAIAELGYVPDGAAQSLARNRKDIIGLVCLEHEAVRTRSSQYDLESMGLVFYEEIMRGVEARIREHDWSLLVTYLNERDALPAGDDGPVLPRLLALVGRVDGLLIGEGVVPTPVLSLLGQRLPVVVISGDPAQRTADMVTADNWSGSYALVEHLVGEHGRRRLFHVDGPAITPDANTRRQAMEAVIAAHPGTVLAGSHHGNFGASSGEEAAEWMLADARRAGRALPDAVVCANDQMAIGVLRALSAHGIRVPEDVAVTGFDDIFPASLCDPPLTTVHQPIRLLGERACERLIERIEDRSLRRKIEVLPTELVIRSSCGCPPGTYGRRPVRHRTPKPASPMPGNPVSPITGR